MDAAGAVNAEKKRLRAVARGRLGAMTPEGFGERSARVAARVRVAAGESGGVLVFLPDHREPDIEPVIAGWLDEGRLVAAPRVDWDAGTFRPVRLRSLEDVEVRRHGVREPAGGETVALGALGISLVPGVAFDGFGGRLGRGGGFYDRFLAGLPAGVRRLGVCFAAQVVERIPLERHDERVDAVVTEEGLISVKEGRGGGALDR